MLGIDVERYQPTRDTFIHQQKFIEEILRKYKVDQLIPSPILTLPNQQMFVDMSSTKENKNDHILELPYWQPSLLGDLQETKSCLCHDPSFQVDAHKSGKQHTKALLKVLQYLKYTSKHGIMYQYGGNEPLQI